MFSRVVPRAIQNNNNNKTLNGVGSFSDENGPKMNIFLHFFPTFMFE